MLTASKTIRQPISRKSLNIVLIYKYEEHNLNIFINRVKAYNPNGRNQTEGEAKEIDGKTSKFLEDNRIPYIMVDGNEEGYDKVVDLVKNEIRLEYNKNHPLFPE